MATATGTAFSAVDLLNKLNTFLTTNGWTKIRGETDIAPASPKAARYWRLLCWEVDSPTADFREINLLEWRTTSGGANVATNGANYSFSSLASGSGSDLVSGPGTIISADINDDMWWVQYDFGTATTIREIVMTCGSQSYALANFAVQWSQDGFSWTTMEIYPYDNTRYTGNNQAFTFTWDSGAGFTHAQHYSATVARRSGASFTDVTGDQNSPDRYEQWNDDIWCWQGPGYDAARRVYVSAITGENNTTSDEFISFTGSIAIDTGFNANDWWMNQSGTLGEDIDAESPTLNISTGSVPYWFYCNNSRFIIVTRNGVDDYSMAYCGFMAAFGQPDDYPFPLLIAASSPGQDHSLADVGTRVRDAQDPASGAAWYRRWDNTWVRVSNHRYHASFNRYWEPGNYAHIWPKHPGVVGRADYPFSITSDYFDGTKHWLDNVDPTDQNDLPVIPSIVIDYTFGSVGAMDGVYVVPAGGILAPEATFTIGADTYRVFTTRAYSEGGHYYCIKEV